MTDSCSLDLEYETLLLLLPQLVCYLSLKHMVNSKMDIFLWKMITIWPITRGRDVRQKSGCSGLLAREDQHKMIYPLWGGNSSSKPTGSACNLVFIVIDRSLGLSAVVDCWSKR